MVAREKASLRRLQFSSVLCSQLPRTSANSPPMLPHSMRTGLTSWNYRTRRQLRIVAQEIYQQARVSPERNFVFLHVPKAGGTSIRHFFRDIFLERSIFPEDRLSNFPLWEDVSSEGPKAYLGHLGWAFARSARAETATVLRDPIERLLSVYVYASKAMLRQPLIGMDSSQMSLIQFLESTQVGIRQNIDNAQTWQLCHCYHWEQREKLAETSDQTIFRAASENLEKIDWLGVSENLSEFCKRLSMSKIQTEKNAPRRNVSSGRLSYSGLSDREKKAMHKCTEMDVALYEKARHRLACCPR